MRRPSPSYAEVAPVEVSSADRVRYRLSRGGDRHLNLALHVVAVNQMRMPRSAGAGLLRRQDRGREHGGGGQALPETSPSRPHLAAHDPRRTTPHIGAREDNRGRLCNPARLA